MAQFSNIVVEAMDSDQIRAKCVMEIKTLDDLQSEKLGSLEGACKTCGKFIKECLGHYAYIDLGDVYIFNPLLFQTTQALLKTICLNCLHSSSDDKKCSHCGHEFERLQISWLKREQKKIFTNIPLYAYVSGPQASHIQSLLDNVPVKQGSKSDRVILHPKYIYKILQYQLFHKSEIRGIVPNIRVLECMMINALPVPPTFVRLLNTPDNQNHAMNMVYRAIVQENDYMKKIQWQDGLYFEFTEENRTALIHMEKFFVACRCVMYKDTSRNSKPQTRQLIMQLLRVSSLEPASCLAQALAKKGWNRQCVSSVRVNMSGRTVITGNPRLCANECVIPKFFAETLFVPIPVNNYNIDYLKGMINRFPEYPCALRVIPRNEHIRYKYINEQTKRMFAAQVQLGDFVCVQIMDGMIGMVNRYPSLREESFGCLRVRVDMEGKSLQFPLSTIVKMTADFDGDEMQFFCLSSLEDQLEAAALYSIPRQFIQYSDGQPCCGNKGWDLPVGIVALQENKAPLMDKRSGLQLMQETMDQIYKQRPALQKSLNYDDGKVIVKDGKIEKYSDAFAALGSSFLRHVAVHHGASVATEFVDRFCNLAYDVNQYCLLSIPPSFFLKLQEYKEIQTMGKERMNRLQQIIDDFHAGRLHAPAGFTPRLFFEKEYSDALSLGIKAQIDRATEIMSSRTDSGFYKGFFKKQVDMVKTALIEKGNMSEAGRFLHDDPFYGRFLISYPKGLHTPETMGYVPGSYIRGLTQKEALLSALNERINIYKKGQSTAISGYFSRRMNQGSCNVFAGHNGVQFTDGGIVISTQYGLNGFDPRCSTRMPFSFHHWSEAKMKDKFGSHPRFKEMQEICSFIKKYEDLRRDIDPLFEEFNEICVPFVFDSETVSEKQLDAIFSVRLCEKMGDVLQDIITSQVFMFYIYALFYLRVDPTSTYDLCGKYRSVLLQAGEMTGLKATLSVSEPLTQANLSAIHAKNGMLSIQREQRTVAAMSRFEELIVRTKAPVVVQFKLIGDLKYNYDANNQFVSKHQTILFSQLEPKVEIIMTTAKTQYSPYVIRVSFKAKQLGFYNVNIQNLIDSIQGANKIIEKVMFNVIQDEKDETVVMLLFSDTELKQINAIQIKTFLLTKQEIGSGLLYNLYNQQVNTDKGTEYIIVGNITNLEKKTSYDSLLRVYQIPGIDQDTVICSGPEFYELFGIERIRAQLYQELLQTCALDTASKNIQPCHVKLLADILTQSGVYSSFTRNQYRKAGQRDMISKFLFEQGEVFLADEIKNPQRQVTNTMLNSVIYGTDAECGATVSKVLFDKKLKVHDHKKMLDDFIK